MNRIKNSYLSLWWVGLWGIILLEIPLLIRWLTIRNKKYTYDDKNIYLSEGILNKNTMSIPLIKIETVEAASNIFGNGSLKINASAAGGRNMQLTTLEYIKGSINARNELTNVIDTVRKEAGIKMVDAF